MGGIFEVLQTSFKLSLRNLHNILSNGYIYLRVLHRKICRTKIFFVRFRLREIFKETAITNERTLRINTIQMGMPRNTQVNRFPLVRDIITEVPVSWVHFLVHELLCLLD